MTPKKLTAAFTAVTFVGTLSLAGPLGLPGGLPLGVWVAGLLWGQRRWPIICLILGILGVLAMRIAELTTAGWLWPVTLLYVTAVLMGPDHTGQAPAGRTASRWTTARWNPFRRNPFRRNPFRRNPFRRTAARWTGLIIGIAAVHAVTAFNLDWTVLRHSADRAMAAVGPDALWLTAALAVALAVRNWQRWMRTALAEQRTAERLRVAQEVHDTVAHTLTVVGVHLNVAADALDTAPDEAKAAMRLAQDVRRKAMGDLSSLVGVLRDERQPPAEPLDLEALVDGARQAGLTATLTVTGETASLPVRLATGIIVREALTNTVRHAGADRVTVTVHYGPTTEVTVTDNGRGSAAPTGRPAGHGLTGMRERVEALGGTLTVDGAGGFAVHATMPS